MAHAGDELDLHGLTVAEALECFVEQYNRRVQQGRRGCWTIVHGYGSSGVGGVIRSRLRGLLRHHADRLRYEAGDAYGNPGETWVYPQSPLPDRQERLAADILGFCATPKTEAKIVARLAIHGGVSVPAAVQSLLRQKRLQCSRQGIRTLYQTVSSAAP